MTTPYEVFQRVKLVHRNEMSILKNILKEKFSKKTLPKRNATAIFPVFWRKPESLTAEIFKKGYRKGQLIIF